MIDFSVCRYKKYILMRADNAGYETDGKSAGRYGVGSADTVYTLFYADIQHITSNSAECRRGNSANSAGRV